MSIFSSYTAERVPALSFKLIREVKNVSKFQKNCATMFYDMNNLHSDKQIHFTAKL